MYESLVGCHCPSQCLELLHFVRFAFGLRGHCENNVICSRAQHNDPSQHLNLRACRVALHGMQRISVFQLPSGQTVNKSWHTNQIVVFNSLKNIDICFCIASKKKIHSTQYKKWFRRQPTRLCHLSWLWGWSGVLTMFKLSNNW